MEGNTVAPRKPRPYGFRKWMAEHEQTVLWGAGLTAGAMFILSCWLYLLGLNGGPVGGAVRVLLSISLLVWVVFLRLSRPQNRSIWRLYRSPRVERVQMIVAAALWLLIIISISGIILWQWHGGH